MGRNKATIKRQTNINNHNVEGLFIYKKKWKFDIAHNLNFHNDWTASFLWLLGKPFVWGPIGHHPQIPKDYILTFYVKKAYYKNKLNWLAKNCFWKLDPFLKICKYKANKINLLLSKDKYICFENIWQRFIGICQLY